MHSPLHCVQMTDSFSYVHLGLGLSSLLGAPAVLEFWRRESWLGASIALYAVVATALMHVSETKHGLVPPEPWKSYSTVFLNMDRVGSYVAVIFCLYSLWPIDVVNPVHVRLLLLTIFGAVCLRVGEWTDHLVLYLVTHLVWHGIAFYVLYKTAVLTQ